MNQPFAVILEGDFQRPPIGVVMGDLLPPADDTRHFLVIGFEVVEEHFFGAASANFGNGSDRRFDDFRTPGVEIGFEQG